MGGDSGAWIIDNETGGVCGHVTAWSEFHQNGTLAPMEVLLHDMEQTLGKPVALPVPDNTVPAQSYKEQLAAAVPPILPPRPEIEIVEEAYNGKAREPSFDSNYGSDTEPDEAADTEPERAGTSCTSTSPVLSTAPSPLMKDLSGFSLNDVAEQWRNSHPQMPISKQTDGIAPGTGIAVHPRQSADGTVQASLDRSGLGVKVKKEINSTAVHTEVVQAPC